jgi:anaerobic selenocysteine-containing dehydrogenase
LFVTNNLLVSQPGTREVYEALRQVEFLVVNELFMTATAELADIVLPARTWLEIEEFVDRYQNFITARRKVIDPVGECRDELQVAYEIVRRMRLKFSIWPGIKKPEDFENFRLKNSGVTFDVLKERYYIMAPMEYKNYEKRGFNTPSGKVELYSSRFEKYGYDPLPHYVEPLEGPISTPEVAEKYPFILITGGGDYFTSIL